MPEISVIMAVKNGRRYLAEAVASVKKQTFRDWEMVIVDDASTDGACEEMAAANTDPRMRFLRHEKSVGCGAPLRRACEESTGRYLAVLDHDDIALPRRLELQRAFLETYSDIALLGCASELIDAWGRPLGLERCVALPEEIYAMSAYLMALRHSSVMFRRDLLERVQYRDMLGVSADYDFVARAVETSRAACLPVVLCRYRLHEGNTSAVSAAKGRCCGAFARMIARRRRLGLSEDYDEWLGVFRGVYLASNDRLAKSCMGCARVFAGQKFFDLAAFDAWLACRHGGGLPAALLYLRYLVNGLGCDRRSWIPLFRAWMKEPAHQLLQTGGMPDRIQF